MNDKALVSFNFFYLFIKHIDITNQNLTLNLCHGCKLIYRPTEVFKKKHFAYKYYSTLSTNPSRNLPNIPLYANIPFLSDTCPFSVDLI